MDQNSIIFLSVDQLRAIIKEVMAEVLGSASGKTVQEGKDETFYSREELCKSSISQTPNCGGWRKLESFAVKNSADGISISVRR